ncbi:MAG: DUF2336 domain-containing protein [Rhodospirillaceae bacterium]|nr:DUF2336 domain-containing protein [Rhodospirillaceae bacterium]
MASHPDRRYRIAVAASTDVAAEILYYMVDDPDPEVRRRIAANPGTPRQADSKLANDEEAGVRAALAAKIANIAPRLAQSEPRAHADLTIDILEKLARDQLPMVRQVVAEVLKNEVHIPIQIMQRLARDIEIMVAAPVLEFSPILDDADLLEIIDEAPIPGALSAISRRRGVGGDVADSLARSDDTDAIIALLHNPTAQMREDTLDALVDRARVLPPLHEPLVRRPVLPNRAACKLATFVADNLLTVLAERKDLDEETLSLVRQAVHTRLAETYGEEGEDTRHRAVIERELATARAMHAKKPISEEQVLRSIGYEHWAFVKAALIVMSGYSLDFVCDVLESADPNLILALCWRAGLGPESAAMVQRDLAGLSAEACLVGAAYPASPDEMQYLLDLFASKVPLLLDKTVSP